MKTRNRSIRNGFSLVEVALALGVASFALLTILGLLPVGIGAQQSSINETVAANIATAVIADLREVPSAYAIALAPTLTTKSTIYNVDVTQASSTIYVDGSGALEPSAANARYKVTITLTQPAAKNRNATYGSIRISWPPAAATPVDSVTVYVALDRN